MRAARATRLYFLIQTMKFLICGVVFYSIYDTEVFVLFFARLVCEITDCDLKISLKDTLCLFSRSKHANFSNENAHILGEKEHF